MIDKIFLFCTLICCSLFTLGQDISKLPLTIKAKPAAKSIIFYLSGDGGMNSFSQNLIQSLNDKNYAVVALDSKKYFWEQKTPDKLAQDLNAVIESYLKNWDKEEFSILGYSFGADAALFLTPRLAKDLQQKLRSTILLSPSSSTDFVIHLTDMMGLGSKNAKYKVLPEINKIGSKLLFIFGEGEDSDLQKAIPDKKNITKTLIPGSHKFDNDIKKVVATIQTEL
ncbi:AcvB/VirJ family lysyl-phosphatidylglycerol hydrolase [Pedobacter sp. UBA5917]|jgi:type IV secretory pathway VirJ component|uniref:AcvB/VirJ family lysyl-phosphatidylglycerol hydrolase n=1 Tax=Pedobacter sp. UBA5917 TaxID=1947061 RepID=UPI0025D578FD|nr:AcvB/VirJ family lysyl-phosphatidylglycerol hydrolase [Pedobacter sp. UBA5917]